MSNSNFSSSTNFGSAYINKKVVMYSIYIPKYNLDEKQFCNDIFECGEKNYVGSPKIMFLTNWKLIFANNLKHLNWWTSIYEQMSMCECDHVWVWTWAFECEHGQIFQQTFEGIYVDYTLLWHGSNIF
jgi:hypothetical protein